MESRLDLSNCLFLANYMDYGGGYGEWPVEPVAAGWSLLFMNRPGYTQ